MRAYSDGSIINHNGACRGMLRYKDDPASKKWHTTTKILTDSKGKPIPFDKKDTKTAKSALREWREALEAQDLVREEEAKRLEEEAKRQAEEAAEAKRLPDAFKLSAYEYVMRYIDIHAKLYDPETQTGGIQPSTANTYRYIAAHIEEGFRGLTLAEVTTAKVEEWLVGMREAGYKQATVAKAYNLLKMVCNDAVDKAELQRNPCTRATTKNMRMGRNDRKKPNALSEGELARLNAALDTIGHTPLADAARIALHTGMRIGEICGMRWVDVDFKRSEIRVRNAIGKDKGTTYTKPPKSGKERTVPMDEEVRSILEARKASMAIECAEMEIAFSSKLYAVGAIAAPEQAAESYQNPNALSKQWSHLAKALNLTGVNGSRPTFHDLRHTFATHAIHEGVDAQTVAAIMGHSSTKMTLDIYSDTLPDAKREAIDHMQGVMGKRADKALILEMSPTGTEGRN